MVLHSAGNSFQTFFSRTNQKRAHFCLLDVPALNDAHNCRHQRTKAHIRLLMPTSFRASSVPQSVLSCPLVIPSGPFRGLGFAPVIRLG